MENNSNNTRKRRRKLSDEHSPNNNQATGSSNSSASGASKQWEPLTFEFQIDKPPPPNAEQNDIPFYVPEKQRRMHAKRSSNSLDNDFVITVYLPQQQQQQQQNMHSSNASSRGNNSANNSGNIFKVYSYRSTEMPSALSQSSSSSSSMDTSPIQRTNQFQSQSSFFNRAHNSDSEASSASPSNPRQDRRYSLDFILNRENREVDKRFNPFRNASRMQQEMMLYQGKDTGCVVYTAILGVGIGFE